MATVARVIVAITHVLICYDGCPDISNTLMKDIFSFNYF